MYVCVFVHSCLYLFVAESLKAYPAAGKLPKATFCVEETVGGRGEEMKWEIERGGEKGKDRGVIIWNPRSYQTLLRHPTASHLQPYFFSSLKHTHIQAHATQIH